MFNYSFTNNLRKSANQLHEFKKLFAIDHDITYAEILNTKSRVYKALNSQMENGKTLIYVACQEGNHQLVNFFLQKKLNPKIKSKVINLK